jgi:hypothetical protein
VDTDWQVAGTGDFNGDGRDDILWRHQDGTIFNFLGTETGGVVNNGDNLCTLVDNGWSLVGIADFNGDGLSDILWRNDSDVIFTFLGTQTGGILNNGDNSWTALGIPREIVGLGDYDGDGRDDILWRDGADQNWPGLIQAASTTGGWATFVELDWQVQDPRLLPYLSGVDGWHS